MRTVRRSIPELIKKALCVLFIFPLVNIAGAQDIKGAKPPLELKVQVDAARQKALVEFTIANEEDILIVITDSMGITMYLENLYRYKGAYKKNVDLGGKGKFKIRVIRDGDQSEKNIETR